MWFGGRTCCGCRELEAGVYEMSLTKLVKKCGMCHASVGYRRTPPKFTPLPGLTEFANETSTISGKLRNSFNFVPFQFNFPLNF
jgi:hypothetical protein